MLILRPSICLFAQVWLLQPAYQLHRPEGELQFLVECSSVKACWVLKPCTVNFTLLTFVMPQIPYFLRPYCPSWATGKHSQGQVLSGWKPSGLFFPPQPGRLPGHSGALDVWLHFLVWVAGRDARTQVRGWDRWAASLPVGKHESPR